MLPEVFLERMKHQLGDEYEDFLKSLERPRAVALRFNPLKGEAPTLPRELEVLHTSNVGRVYTYIVRGSAQSVTERIGREQPLMVEALPLSLEEIFIYELGGEQYAVQDIIL